MMATFSFCRFRGYVYTVYTHDRRRFKISTGLKVPDKYWIGNQLSARIPGYSEKFATIQKAMQKLMDTVSVIKSRGEYPSTICVRNEFRGNPVSTGVSNDYNEICVRYTCAKESKTSPRTVTNTRQMFRVFNGYCEKFGYRFDPKTFTRREFEQFEMYMASDLNLNDNTVCKHVRMFKTFLRWAYPEMKKDFVFHKEYEGEIIYLEEAELNYLIDYPLVGHQERVRDLLVFLCLTGMRFSDSQRVNKSWERDGIFLFRQRKTGGIATPVIFEAAKAILEKYGGQVPRMSSQVFNRDLKKLFRDMDLTREVEISEVRNGQRHFTTLQLCDIVTSHIGRKTFITTCLNKGIPLQDVMRMSGHSDYRAMKPYMAISKDHIKEVARKWEI